MSSARCLNWSRPPPGRHPALRKQVSCSEVPPYSASAPAAPSACPSSSSSSASSSSSVNTCRRPPLVRPTGDGDYCQFLVTSAIIHTNRFQTYHTYDQARRGGSASLVRQRPLGVFPGEDDQASGGRRPASASGPRTTPAAGDRSSLLARTEERPARRAILCKQLSLDQSVLGRRTTTAAAASSFGAAGGMAAGLSEVAMAAAATLVSGSDGTAGESGLGTAWSNGFNRKQQRAGVGAGMKPDSDGQVGKKGLKAGPGKDARINIKIFLGQTVQQDSSDTGVSDTEGTAGATPREQGYCNGDQQKPSSALSLPVPNVPTDSPPAAASVSSGTGKNKPTNGPPGAPSNPATQTNYSPNAAATSGGPGSGGSSAAATNGGRNSSLAQRRAQFQANRQNSEAHDRRHPPLVRALSAPIRPADPDSAKFLQGKKKPRRRKVLREKDEYNICEEDEFSDDGDGKMVTGLSSFGAAAAAGKHLSSVLPMRSRSVLGGACDIETLVSLLSSGGSDSEKEQDTSTQASSPRTGNQSPTGAPPPATASYKQFSSAHHNQHHQHHHPKGGRAPMLKKAGKSVSFQETDLKPAAVPSAGLNRDYRKPSFQPTTVASRIRRTQQLVSTLNAFQLKDKDKSNGRDSSEEKQHDRSTDTNPASPTRAESPAKSSSTSSAGKSEPSKANANGAPGATNGDLQTPKEQECYRLFLKMSKKGLAVSYDTILRGMLTPTELRVLQKKKSRERNNNDAGEGGTENGGGELSPENGEGGPLAFEELQLKELPFHGKGEGDRHEPQDEPPSPGQTAEKDSDTDGEPTS